MALLATYLVNTRRSQVLLLAALPIGIVLFLVLKTPSMLLLPAVSIVMTVRFLIHWRSSGDAVADRAALDSGVDKHRSASGVARASLPAWVLALLDPQDADRYGREWAAHLHQRISDGELRQARLDRRRLIRLAVLLAVTHQARAAVRKR